MDAAQAAIRRADCFWLPSSTGEVAALAERSLRSKGARFCRTGPRGKLPRTRHGSAQLRPFFQSSPRSSTPLTTGAFLTDHQCRRRLFLRRLSRRRRLEARRCQPRPDRHPPRVHDIRGLMSGCSRPDRIVRPCLLPQSRTRPEGPSSSGGESRGLFHRRSFAAFSGDMEATTSSATESDKLITCPVAAGCLIPELQADAIPFGALAVEMNTLPQAASARGRIQLDLAIEDHTSGRVPVSRRAPKLIVWFARMWREASPVQRCAGMLTRGEKVETRRIETSAVPARPSTK